MITATDQIWHEGQFVPWWEARVHLLSHAVQFGSSIFEGVRCYETPDGPAMFRWPEHLRRLYDSCRIYRMQPRWTPEQLTRAAAELVDRNGLSSCYIRPMVLRGYGDAGMLPKDAPIETYIACWPWGTYLGDGALERGVDVCISSWNRPAPNTFPVMAKSAGHYNNGQLIKMEAIANGYEEAIALGPDGLVSEGSGQNVFVVRDGLIFTPPVDGTILHGITRASIMTMAADYGLRVRERPIPREMLYTADEVFLTGTAAEVTPVRSVDRVAIGGGKPGPITRRLQRHFLDLVHGRLADERGWLLHVHRILQRHETVLAGV